MLRNGLIPVEKKSFPSYQILKSVLHIYRITLFLQLNIKCFKKVQYDLCLLCLIKYIKNKVFSFRYF